MLQYRRNGWADFSDADMKKFKAYPCKGCLAATRNQTHSKHKRQTDITRNCKRQENVGHFHCDIMFLSKEAKFTSAIVMVDEKTRYTHLRFIDTKSFTSEEAISCFNDLRACVQEYGHTIRSIRWDGEQAIWSDKFGKYLDRHNITRDRNTSSEQNLAESKIGKIRAKAVRLLYDRDIPRDLFEHYAYRHATMLLNIQITEPLMGRTPYQEYELSNPQRAIQRLRTFGAVAYYLPTNTDKHTSAKPYIFVGYDKLKSANYMLYNPRTERINTTNEAKFIETILPRNWYDNVIKGNDLHYSGGDMLPQTPTDEEIQNERAPPFLTPENSESEYDTADEITDTPQDAQAEAQIPLRRSTRYRKNPERYVEIHYIASTNRLEFTNTVEKRHQTLLQQEYPKKIYIIIPKNRREMLKSKYKDEFLKAEEIELATLQRHDTIQFVKNDKKKHKLKTRMVYDVKADEHGNVVKFKARLVALGYDMRKDEYKETYAPVARWTTLMIMIVLGWYYLMDIYLLDFKGAYLHSTRPTSTPVYLYDIPGIKTPPDKMIYLNKGLYGTLDAGNLWRQTVEKLLLSNGYTQAINDPCLFYKTRTINGKTYKTYIATWVDDLLIVSNDPETKNMKKDFEEKGFEISHFDKINKYLGVNVNYDKEKDILTFDQCDYIDEILQNANMQNANGITTPMVKPYPSKADCPNQKLIDAKLNSTNIEDYNMLAKEIYGEIETMKNVPYRNVLGALSHLTRMTRPDIQFSTFFHSRYQTNPGRRHWQGIKRILRYIKATRNCKLYANRDAPLLEIYSDSDHGGDPDERKSTTGICIMIYGVPVLVKSRIQRMNAKSSTNAEIIALCDTVEETVWIKHLLTELGEKVDQPTIQVDNDPAIDTVKHSKICKGNKHIANRYYFVKDYLKQNIIKIEHVDTHENIADICTKALDKQTFEYLREKMNLK